MANELSLNCELNKNCFIVGGHSQIAYLLIEAKSTNGKIGEKTPLNLCLVMDRSASMKGDKIENVKKAIFNIIDRMNEDDFLSVVVFNEESEIVISSQNVTDKEELKDAVNEISYNGGTAISTGLKEGLAELKKNISKDKINRMIVLTDGQTYGDEDDCYQLAADALSDDITITALGVGDEWYEEVLDTIAEKNIGKSDYIETPDDIISIFDEEMTTLENIVTQNNVMTFRFSDGVKPRKICRVVPYIEELENASFSESEVKVDIGELDKKQGQSLLLEVLLPSKPQGNFRLAQAELCYDIPSQSIFQQKVREDVVAEFTTDEKLCKKINSKVMNMAERVSAYNLQTRAIAQASEGDVSGATQKLRAAATRLLDLDEQELADTALTELENLEHEGKMSSAGTKKLRYETRKLTRRLVV